MFWSVCQLLAVAQRGPAVVAKDIPEDVAAIRDTFATCTGEAAHVLETSAKAVNVPEEVLVVAMNRRAGQLQRQADGLGADPPSESEADCSEFE